MGKFGNAAEAWAIAPVAMLSLALAGCVNTTDALQTGPDTFTVTSTADGMRTASDARQSALRTAAERCNSMGRTIAVIREDMAMTRMGIDTTITIDFRCLPRSSAPSLVRPPAVIGAEVRGGRAADPPPAATSIRALRRAAGPEQPIPHAAPPA